MFGLDTGAVLRRATKKRMNKCKKIIIVPVIEGYKSGKITYAEAEFNARVKIYQSVKPDFNPDVEYMKDPLSRDIPSVDNILFILARKLILNSTSNEI